MELIPEQKTVPAQNLNEYSILVFGQPGIGKTSFAAQFPNSMFALTETGTKAMSVYETDIAQRAKMSGKMEWEVFMELVEEFIKGNHDFETFVIDTEDKLYEYCMDYMIEKKLKDHPGNVSDFGKSWRMVTKEFEKPHDMIKSSEYGLISISHSKYKEIENAKGKKVDRVRPAISGSSADYLINDADIIIFYDVDKDDNRLLRVNSTREFDAKQRISTFPNEPIPAGNSAEEAFENFKSAFDEAIEELNRKLDVTEEDIKNHYEKIEEQKDKIPFEELRKKIVNTCKQVGIDKETNSDMLEEEYGVRNTGELTYNQAEEYLEKLKEEN